jgi:hypothetical protein
MLLSDRVLQQQYRAKNYQVYSQLIHTSTQVEKHDELLLKILSTQCTEKFKIISSPLQRTNLVNANTTRSKNLIHIHEKEERPKNDTKYHKCGDFSHFSKNCRTSKHLVALYQKSLKENKQAGGTRYETHQSCIRGCQGQEFFTPGVKGTSEQQRF